MTTYHRFFVPHGSSVSLNKVEAIVLGTCIRCSLDEGLIRIDNVEVGIVEFTARDHPTFADDLSLVLRQAKSSKLDEHVIAQLQDCAGFLLFQPLNDKAADWQELFWRELFKTFPDAILVLNSGSCILSACC